MPILSRTSRDTFRSRRILRGIGLACFVFAVAVAMCVFIHFHPKLFMTVIGGARTLGFFLLAVVSAWMIIGNWVGMVTALTSKCSYSLVPLVGGMFGVMACRCGPVAIQPYAWIPLLLDPGTWVVPYILVRLLARWAFRKVRRR